VKGERGKIKIFYLDKTRHGEQSDTAMSPWMWKNAEVSIYTRGTHLMELLLPDTFHLCMMITENISYILLRSMITMLLQNQMPVLP
jgi:hypothetical protein